MLFRVLGPVVIETDDGEVVTLTRRRERGMLAVLLLECNRVVPIERLIGLLWDDPPEHVQRALRSHAAHIRALLNQVAAAGYGVALLSEGDGYLMRVDPDRVDAHRFRALVAAAANTADPAGRARVLDEALALWRGPALHNAATEPLRTRVCVDLDELRMHATEESLAAGLTAGNHHALVARLAALATAHPLRERVIELYMTALHRAGRTPDALAVYTRARTHFAEDLGLDLGEPLRALHREILGGAPEPPPTVAGTGPAAAAAAPEPESAPPAARRPPPAHLPPDLAGFTGREAQLRQLDALLPDRDSGPGTGGPVVISAIAGTAGVGKTALAVHWAHRVGDRFPDGHLYVNLNGFSSSPPVRPIEALAVLLGALGVTAERVPATVEQASGLYRSILAGKRALVILDNARTADQVRPLLPGAASCLVLVTSRDRLSGLVALDGARRITVDVLTPDEAVRLVAHVVGAERVAAEPAATAALASACAHLPLALRIAAANLADHPGRSIARQVADLLAGDRLAALRIEGDEDRAVRAAFDLSYRALSPDDRRMFRLLGLVPGTDVAVEAVAALAGTTVELAGRRVEHMVGVHLLTERAPGRYTMHDLLRGYAAQRAAEDEPHDQRVAAVARLFDHYLRAVDAATDLLKPEALRLPREPADPGVPPARFRDRAHALGWLTDEQPNLVAAVIHAADHGPRPAAWRLADALRAYFWLGALLPDWVGVANAGLAAAELDGDVQAQAACELSLADAYDRHARYRDAVTHYARASALMRRAGWLDGEATTLNNLGLVYARTGRLAKAADHYQQALAIKRRLGNALSEATALLNLGVLCYTLGRLTTAADHGGQAVALYRQAGSRDGEGIALSNLGEATAALGRLADARDQLTAALAINREVGDRTTETETLRLLATVHRDSGRYTEALAMARRAQSLVGDTGDRRTNPDVLNTAGTILRSLRRTGEAVEHHGRALELARATETRGSEIEAVIGLAAATLDLGEAERSREHAQQAAILAAQGGYRLLEGQALTSVGAAEYAAGRPDAATRTAHDALAVHRETGHRLGEAHTAALLGQLSLDTGDVAACREYRQRALLHYAEIGSPEAAVMRSLLAFPTGGPAPAARA